MIYFTEEEWKDIKEKLVKISPKTLLILIVFIIGFASGWHSKGAETIMDCKFSNSFRISTDSFTCNKKL